MLQKSPVERFVTFFPFPNSSNIIWARTCENTSYTIWKQQSCRSACATTQYDQHLCCLLLRWYDMYTCYIQSFKILASFCSWAGWFECFLVENPRRHVFAWCGSFGPCQANLVLIAYASSEGSGEPAHPRNLARTFAARSYKQWAKRNLQTESQIPGPCEWLGMRS